jgi:hypothetical protein
MLLYNVKKHKNLFIFFRPGLAWDAALKKTNITLELLTDNTMIDFFIEKGTMRGGISTVCKKKMSIANNKYLPNYNDKISSNYIMYFDVTNLYGYTMTFSLPTNNFKWIDIIDKHYDINYLKNIILDKTIGYIFEVDLIYPLTLKDNHCELPLAPEHYDNKLSPNLFNKNNYRTRLENLIFYIDNGLIIHRIHKILQFNQSPWLKDYIEYNTNLRNNSKSESEKNFYKLMNNAV